MKLPKINKQTIQSFFLYHAEKLIILLAVGLMGWFFWSGYKTEVFDETTPQQLKTMADQAGTYINADDSWTQIVDSRLAVESLPVILNDEGIDPAGFKIAIPSVAVKSLAPRNDPELFPVTELTATPFTAPVFLATNGRKKDPLDKLPFAAQADVEEEDDDRRRTPARRQPRRTKSDDDEVEVKIPGENVPLVMQHESAGLRPGSTRLGRNDRVFLLNGVAVNGVVDVKQQYNNYQASFAFGAGYYPERDHPSYQYVQIERAKVVDGTPGDWQDISQRIHESQTRLYPAAAPEVVAPENYDQILTGVIPPLTLVDYKPLSLHPKVSAREFPDLDEDGQAIGEENGTESRGGGGLFAASGDDDQVERRVGQGGTRNNSSRGSRGNNRSRSLAQRRGSDRRPYEAMAAELEPTADHKLVRFFDLATEQGATYAYRVRLWLTDPNNEPDEETRRGGRSGGRGRGDTAGYEDDFGEDEYSEEDLGGRSSRGGGRGRSTRGGGRSGRGLASDEKPEKVYTKIPITQNMKSKESRARLARAREEEDSEDATRYIYYVAEAYGEGEGNDRYEEIKVPRRAKIDLDALFDLDELRFSRPTKWSEPVIVTIPTGTQSELATGDVIPPKMDRVGSVEVPDGEPIAEMAVAIWSTDYKTLLPTKEEVRRGDLLNYFADSNLLNPLTWTVHKAEQQEINTGKVMVDIMGGGAVDTGRSRELMPPSLPGETLIMGPDGTFELHNDFDDQTMYRHSLFINDDSAEVGEVKEPKRKDRGRGRGEFER